MAKRLLFRPHRTRSDRKNLRAEGVSRGPKHTSLESFMTGFPNQSPPPCVAASLCRDTRPTCRVCRLCRRASLARCRRGHRKAKLSGPKKPVLAE